MKSYVKEHGASYFPPSLIYSPGIVGIRRDDGDGFNSVDDDFSPELDAIPADPTTAELELPPAVNTSNQKAMGEYTTPYIMNVISAIPVNAHLIRATAKSSPSASPSTSPKESITCVASPSVEFAIRKSMKDRMGRALRAFELNRDRVLVLGAFGYNEGVAVDVAAQIWAELLACTPSDDAEGNGRFRNVFEKVIFAVPGKHHALFRQAFDMRVFEDELERELIL